MQTTSLSLRAAARTTLRAALAWAGRTLPMLFKTAAKTIREDFSHPLTPREEGIVFCGMVMLFLWGINKVILTFIETMPALRFLIPDDIEVLVIGSIVGGLIIGVGVGAVATLLWFTGRDIRRRGGLGGKALASEPAAGPSTPVQE